MADLTFFVYHKGHSSIHKTNPTLKMILLILSSIIISTGSRVILIYYMVIILWGFYLSGLKAILLLKDLKYLLILGILISLFQSSIINALVYITRIGEILLLGTIFTGTTKPEDIAPCIYRIIPNRLISQNISLTIILIPTFLIRWKDIETTLKSRGLYIRKNPIRILYGTVIPLLLETFKRADSISIAMESRCYTGWVDSKSEDKKINYPLIMLILLPFLLWIKRLLQ